MYLILYGAYFLALCLQGALFTIPSTSDRVRTFISIVSPLLGLSILILAILEKSWTLAIIAVLFYFVVPGVAQTLTLLCTGRVRQISSFSWIITAVFIIIVAYCLITGRIMTI